MEDRTSNYYIINSGDRLTGIAENCTVRNQNFADSFSYRVTKIIIPFTYYNVNSNYNVLKILSGVTTYTVTVPVGQYSITNLLTTLTSLLNALGVGTFTLSYDSVTFKITITNGTIAFTYLGTVSTINDILGFNSVDTSSALTHTGDNIFNLGGTDYIDIVSRTLSNSESKSRSTSSSGSNIIIRIPTSQYSFGQTIFYQPFHNHQWTFRMNLQEDIDLLLIDDSGNQIDLNGRDWEMTLKYHSHKSNNPGNESRTHHRQSEHERFYIN